jgi:2-dehydro-3-deoxyphosphogluconate aldolase / (4S)-4-hydroxy-2-oxoglutarate aldolase
MHKKDRALQQLLDQQCLPLFYHDSYELSLQVLQALYDAGIRILEYTARGAKALENFGLLRKACNASMPELLLGIGTIKTAAQADDFISSGADFIVCPTINPQVADAVQKKGLLWIPGCMTPTEIAAAEEAGARIVKIFPGNILGPSYITAISDLFQSIQFMPTGGVEPELQNLRAWFASGVVAVGMGSKLITKEILQKEDFKRLKEKTEEMLQLIKKANN